MVTAYTRAKGLDLKGHSVQKLEQKRTDGGDCIASRANAVGRKKSI